MHLRPGEVEYEIAGKLQLRPWTIPGNRAVTCAASPPDAGHDTRAPVIGQFGRTENARKQTDQLPGMTQSIKLETQLGVILSTNNASATTDDVCNVFLHTDTLRIPASNCSGCGYSCRSLSSQEQLGNVPLANGSAPLLLDCQRLRRSATSKASGSTSVIGLIPEGVSNRQVGPPFSQSS